MVGGTLTRASAVCVGLGVSGASPKTEKSLKKETPIVMMGTTIQFGQVIVSFLCYDTAIDKKGNGLKWCRWKRLFGTPPGQSCRDTRNICESPHRARTATVCGLRPDRIGLSVPKTTSDASSTMAEMTQTPKSYMFQRDSQTPLRT